MKTKNKPAFPVEVSIDVDGNLVGSQTSNFSGFEMGLTKREYFVAKAMQGLLSNPEWFKGEKYMLNDILTETAISAADAVLDKLSIKDDQ